MSPKLDPKQDYTPGKLSKTNMIGWKIHHLKLYFLLKMGILQCYVSFQGYTWQESENRAYNPPSYVMLCWFPTISFLGCKNPPSLDWWNHQIFGEKKSPIRNLEVGMFCQAGVEEGVMVWERCFLFGGGNHGGWAQWSNSSMTGMQNGCNKMLSLLSSLSLFELFLCSIVHFWKDGVIQNNSWVKASKINIPKDVVSPKSLQRMVVA